MRVRYREKRGEFMGFIGSSIHWFMALRRSLQASKRSALSGA
jgi:hypothetical protein